MIRFRSVSSAAALVALVPATVAQAQLIVGNDQPGTATIYNVNINTLVATPIYSAADASAKPWGLASDRTGRRLWWNSGSMLFSAPWEPTLTPTNHGVLTLNGSPIEYTGLSFFNGKLYGTRNEPTEAVYEIDTTTLAGTLVYQFPSAFDFGGLEHDPFNGRLYALSDTGQPGLWEFDLSGQTQFFRAPYPAGETDIDGLAIFLGTAYYVTDGPNFGPGAQPFFYTYNVNSGAFLRTIPSPFTGSGTNAAATWAMIPEPSSLSFVALGALAALRRRCA